MGLLRKLGIANDADMVYIAEADSRVLGKIGKKIGKSVEEHFMSPTGWMCIASFENGGAIFENGERRIELGRLPDGCWYADVLCIRGAVRVYSRERVGAVDKALRVLVSCRQLEEIL